MRLLLGAPYAVSRKGNFTVGCGGICWPLLVGDKVRLSKYKKMGKKMLGWIDGGRSGEMRHCWISLIMRRCGRWGGTGGG